METSPEVALDEEPLDRVDVASNSQQEGRQGPEMFTQQLPGRAEPKGCRRLVCWNVSSLETGLASLVSPGPCLWPGDSWLVGGQGPRGSSDPPPENRLPPAGRVLLRARHHTSRWLGL